MPDKFIVPQFIDKEDQILGPVTVRQFLICLAAVFAIFIENVIFQFAYFLMLAMVTAAAAGIFAFVKINGQPFHIFFINFLQTSLRPSLRAWNKNLLDEEVKQYLKTAAPEVVLPRPSKERPVSVRLRDLSLVVNTGGVYKPEDELMP